MSEPIRVAIVGAGVFGRNHLRVISQNSGARLVAVADTDRERAEKAAQEFSCRALADWRELAGEVDAAVVATPTVTHAEVGCGLMEAGIDVLVEKPVASELAPAQRLCRTAETTGRILQVGHLERFNPAVRALAGMVRLPLFFEVHRMSVFAPRSLDIDVVLDLMIHDLDIVLQYVGEMPSEVRAAGIKILSDRVDIANVRLSFPSGCIANLTASRASTERVRKLRLFQPHQYISIDYSRQDGVVISVGEGSQIGFQPLAVDKKEPLAAQLEAFLESVRQRTAPVVSGTDAVRALAVALGITRGIEEHAKIVERTIARGGLTGSAGKTST